MKLVDLPAQVRNVIDPMISGVVDFEGSHTHELTFGNNTRKGSGNDEVSDLVK